MAWVKSAQKSFFDSKNDSSDGVNNDAFFICKNCNFSKPIPPLTIIYSKNFSNVSTESVDYTYTIYDKSLFRTKNYICRNKKCPTHSDSEKKEAVITKNVYDQVVYICVECQHNWTSII